MSPTKKKGIPIWVDIVFGILVIVLAVVLSFHVSPEEVTFQPSDISSAQSNITLETSEYSSSWDVRILDDISITKTAD